MSETPEQDTDLWKVMVSGNILRDLTDIPSSMVLVLGPMGAGKSTAIAIQTGAKYKAEKEIVEGRKKRVYQCVQADHRRPQTSDGYTSKTLNVGLYTADKKYGGCSYLDTAGMNEDRSDAHRLYTQWSLSMIFSILPKIQCVILVMDFRSLVTERGHGLREIARSLGRIIGTGHAASHFYDSMAFLFTNAYEDGDRVSADSIRLIALKQREEQEEWLKKKTTAKKTDEAAPEEQLERGAVWMLLKALAEATGRVHVCFPDSPLESEKQRVTVQSMVDHAKPMTKDMLMEIVAVRETSTLKVLQILVKLISEPEKALGGTSGIEQDKGRTFTELLRHRRDNLKRLNELQQQHKLQLQAIERDWRSVQREKIGSLRAELEDKSKQKKSAEDKMREKQTSQKLTVIQCHTVTKACPTSGWWALCMFGGGWGWGRSTAERTLDYKGVWFSKWKDDGKNYKKTVCSDDPDNGVLKIDFESDPRTDLSVEVKLYRPESRTEDAELFVETLKREVKDLNGQISQLERKITATECADSKQALVDLLLEDKEEIVEMDKAIVDLLDKPAVHASICADTPPSVWCVMSRLHGMLSVLVDKNLLPDDLAGSTRDSIIGFIHTFNEVDALLKAVSRGAGSSLIELKTARSSTVAAEDAPPVKPSLRIRCMQALQSLPVDPAADGAAKLYSASKQSAVAAAIGLLVYAMLLKASPASNLQGAVGNVLVGICTYIIADTVLSSGMHRVSMMVNSLCSQCANVKSELCLAVKECSSGGVDAIRQLAEGLPDAMSKKSLVSVHCFGGGS